MMLMPSIFRNNVFDGFFDGFGFSDPWMTREMKAVPAMKTDVKETDGGYELAIDLPGYKKEDVKAELKDGCLTVTAETSSNNDKKDDNGKYIRRERYSGSVSRSYYVGEEIKTEDLKARFENGTLFIDVPKKEALPKTEEKKYVMIEG